MRGGEIRKVDGRKGVEGQGQGWEGREGRRRRREGQGGKGGREDKGRERA
jgi:hypothetical protein